MNMSALHHSIIRRGMFILLALIACPFLAHGQEAMTSSNYQVHHGTFGSGGITESRSERFSQQSMLGEAIVADQSDGAQFRSQAGFVALLGGESPESPPGAQPPEEPPSPGGGGIIQQRATAIAAAAMCAGADFNTDGAVDVLDFAVLVFFWGTGPAENPCVDINGSGVVDLVDFGSFVFAWTG